MIVHLTGISQRGRNRIREHGSRMLLIRREDGRILVESLENTWNGEKWKGWFILAVDVAM